MSFVIVSHGDSIKKNKLALGTGEIAGKILVLHVPNSISILSNTHGLLCLVRSKSWEAPGIVNLSPLP